MSLFFVVWDVSPCAKTCQLKLRPRVPFIFYLLLFRTECDKMMARVLTNGVNVLKGMKERDR